jgi:cytochrome c oxidase assembly protein subunit 15
MAMATSRSRLVGWWLSIAAAMAFALIVLGGVVRLTRSGLSITEWAPVTGIFPPIGDAAWQSAFAKYQATPEYQQVNAGMSMAAFHTIFLLEYAHRLLGRLTGLVLAVPLLYLLVRRKLSVREARPILYVLAAGLGQGILGWLMVASGLVDVPHVSPRRLAAHLVVGIALFASLVWMIAARRRSPATPPVTRRTRALAYVTLALATVTVGWGGLMAGTHAGLVFPTFPKMAGRWVPTDLATHPGALATDLVMIHFTHRALALALTAACIALAAATFRLSTRARALGAALLVAVTVQITLGALVVIHHVPIVLASLHQANAVVLVGVLATLVSDLAHAPRAATESGARIEDDAASEAVVGHVVQDLVDARHGRVVDEGR